MGDDCQTTKLMGDWMYTYRYYYDGASIIEERNKDCATIRQYVWGTQYVDELVQIGINQDPGDKAHENLCERFFWVTQDANYNVTGLLNATGILTERYEYTPYGERTVFSRNWRVADMNDDGVVDVNDYYIWLALYDNPTGYTHAASRADLNGDGHVDINDYYIWAAESGYPTIDTDTTVMYPRLESCHGRYESDAYPALEQVLGAYGTCDVGHQGLFFDKEWECYDNRGRIYDPKLGRFLQRDPIGNGDGNSLYGYCRSNPLNLVDPRGLAAEDHWEADPGLTETPFVYERPQRPAIFSKIEISKAADGGELLAVTVRPGPEYPSLSGREDYGTDFLGDIAGPGGRGFDKEKGIHPDKDSAQVAVKSEREGAAPELRTNANAPTLPPLESSADYAVYKPRERGANWDWVGGIKEEFNEDGQATNLKRVAVFWQTPIIKGATKVTVVLIHTDTTPGHEEDVPVVLASWQAKREDGKWFYRKNSEDVGKKGEADVRKVVEERTGFTIVHRVPEDPKNDTEGYDTGYDIVTPEFAKEYQRKVGKP